MDHCHPVCLRPSLARHRPLERGADFKTAPAGHPLVGACPTRRLPAPSSRCSSPPGAGTSCCCRARTCTLGRLCSEAGLEHCKRQARGQLMHTPRCMHSIGDFKRSSQSNQQHPSAHTLHSHALRPCLHSTPCTLQSGYGNACVWTGRLDAQQQRTQVRSQTGENKRNRGVREEWGMGRECRRGDEQARESLCAKRACSCSAVQCYGRASYPLLLHCCCSCGCWYSQPEPEG